MLHRILLPLIDCDLKFEKGDTGVFEGYASVYGNVDSDGDTITKGTFAAAVDAKQTIPIFYGHSWRSFMGTPGMPIGKSQQLAEDDHGLHMRANFTLGSSGGRDAYALTKDGAMSGLSVGMLIPKDGASNKEKGEGRVITKARLLEVSVLPFQSNPDAIVTDVKEAIEAIETLSDCEFVLRDAGLSRASAKTLLARFKSVCLRDAGDTELELKSAKDQLSAALRRIEDADRLARLTQLVRG
jgi:uncharacterized protein